MREKISRWNPSSHVIREILTGLDVLSVRPADHLIRVGPPDDALQFDLVIRDPDEPSRDYLYTFTVRYAADEETLFVVHCGRMSEDRLDG